MSLKTILEQHYGLRITELAPMEGYESSNFRVHTPNRTYVCKKYENTPRIREEIGSENRVLEELNELAPYQFPAPIRTLSKEAYVETGDSLYRVLTYIEGEFLGSVPHTPKMLYSLGQFLGKLDHRLNGVSEMALEARRIPWDLRNLVMSVPLLESIPDVSDRNIVAYFFMQFEDHVRPVAHKLRETLIYSDANDWNILTDGEKVTGTIDFGDMCYSWLINEVAIGMAYVMMQKEDPLEQGLHVLKGYQDEVSLTETECDSLFYLIAARLCISVCQSARASRQKPDSAYITVSEAGAWKLLKQLLKINPMEAANRFREVCGFQKLQAPSSARLIKNRKEHFGKNLSLSYSRPIQMHKAAFQYMYDSEGNTFLDAYNNIMLVGHCHPRVADAGRMAMGRLNTNTRYLFEALEKYSEALLKKFPPVLNKVFFVNSGSEASDLAIRMAKFHTGKEKVAVLEHGYHGHTQGGMDISSYKFSQNNAGGRPTETQVLPLPKVYGTSLPDDGTAGRVFAAEALTQLEKNRDTFAAFIAEPIVGCGGQVPLARGYLNAVYEGIRSQSGLCISDEVQVGFGRLGEAFWGYELHGVVPDIVVLGKPMGNGHPMGAVVTTAEIAESFGKGPEFFSSFGGNPVSCAIGLAVLEVMEEEKRQEHALITGNYLKGQLRKLKEKHKTIGDVRGNGLFLGVELINEIGQAHTKLASGLKNGLRESFVLVGTDGPFDNVIKIKPPLRFDLQNADELVAKIDHILSQNLVYS